MRKTILSAIAATVAVLCFSLTAHAVPAKPGKIRFLQPDGTSIIIQVHGDEWFHWVTDESGNYMEEDTNGFMVKSSRITDLTISEGLAKAQAQRLQVIESAKQAVLKAASSNVGERRFPVILVQFSDTKFTISNPKEAFTRLLNEEGYSSNGAVGSVRDYYLAQSRGRFQPIFDVYGPVTLSNSSSYYAGSTGTANVRSAMYEACNSIKNEIDFSQYDSDGNKVVDIIAMYYAGNNQAEGGGTSTIWPHKSVVGQKVGDYTLYDYFCTSELKGSSGSSMCGIGTACHEFAHALGLPDFYDTNYNNYGDGNATATGAFDLMCSGSYNNDGITPPWMNAEELVMLGWMDSITEISTTGTVTIPAISADSPVAYKTATSVNGEYFVYECRGGDSWDEPLPTGMLVYHVDKSTSHKITWNTSSSSTSSATAYNLWYNWNSYNAVNCNASHPCFYIVPSAAQTSTTYSGSNSYFPFPGSGRVTSYTPVEWSGEQTGFSATSITFNSSSRTVTFNLVNSNSAGLNGYVLDSDGVGIPGATVTLSAEGASSSTVSSKFSDINLISRSGSALKASGNSGLVAIADADGFYEFAELAQGTYAVTVEASGYVSKTSTLVVSRQLSHNFFLLREGETPRTDLFTYHVDSTDYVLGNSSSMAWNYMVADIFTTAYLGPNVGKQIKSISFQLNGDENSPGQVYAILDYGSERKLTLDVTGDVVTDDWTTVDLTDYDLMIPDGTEIYAGYALVDWTYTSPFVVQITEDEENIGYIADTDLNSSAWEALTLSDETFVVKVKLTIGDYSAPDNGYSYIDNPGDGTYSAGTAFALNLVETTGDRKPGSEVSWFYDDEPVSGATVTLSKTGLHTVTARYTTSAGKRKVVELEITVE